MLELIPLLLSAAKPLLDRLIPDENARAAAQEELQKALISQQGAIQQAIAEAAKAQAEVNLEEAKSPSMFVAGWRPAVGWVCVFGFGYSFILQPLMNGVLALFHVATLPGLDTGPLMTLMMGMLGLAATRTVEKVQGVASPNMGAPPKK